jgi:hypothetical protein
LPKINYSILHNVHCHQTDVTRLTIKRNRAQELVNKRIQQTEVSVESNYCDSESSSSDDEMGDIILYDISQGSNYPPLKIFQCKKPSSYAFSPNGKYFAYIKNLEDAVGGEDPCLEIVRLFTWKQLHWERRRNAMMFFAGYGFLNVMQKRSISSTKAFGYYIMGFVSSNMRQSFDQYTALSRKRSSLDETIENSVVQALFKVFQCPNVLQLIVLYL